MPFLVLQLGPRPALPQALLWVLLQALLRVLLQAVLQAPPLVFRPVLPPVLPLVALLVPLALTMRLAPNRAKPLVMCVAQQLLWDLEQDWMKLSERERVLLTLPQ